MTTYQKTAPDGSSRSYICIFAKPPIPGQTKSRLAKVIGNELAAELSAAMLYDITKQACDVNQCRVAVFYPPGFSADDYGLLAEFNLEYFEQSGSELGQRMCNAFKFILNDLSAESCIIIGSDCISHTTDLLDQALRLLQDSDVVVQPAEDGGYTLIGQSQLVSEIFKNIHWGTDTVMQSTLDILLKLPIDYVTLDTAFDIDTAEDLAKLREHTSKGPTTRCVEVLKKI